MPRRARRLVPKRLRLALVFTAIALALGTAAYLSSGFLQSRLLPDRIALRGALNANDVRYMATAYEARHFKPIWLSGRSAPAASALIDRLENSEVDGLSPKVYGVQSLRRHVAHLPEADVSERVRTELLLSRAYVAFVRDLHTPAPGADLVFPDPALKPRFRDIEEIIEHLASARSVQMASEQSFRMNGFYLQMREEFSRYRRLFPSDHATAKMLLQNLDRLRALPIRLGQRFVIVNTAANRLWLFEGKRRVRTMKVIVGTATEQTPQMAGLIRYSIFEPFWNVPPDITRNTYAPRIAADPPLLAKLRMDPWSDFTRGAVKLDPQGINWSAVAEGSSLGWLRQRPGGNNAMGAVKFMLPNRLGIYLHDTPERGLFARANRFFSSGCVRVEDAQSLSRWLYGGVVHQKRGDTPEQRIDLPAPVPVYITYLTATPDKGRIQRYRDTYGRDRQRLAARTMTSGARPSDSIRMMPDLQNASQARAVAGRRVATVQIERL